MGGHYLRLKDRDRARGMGGYYLKTKGQMDRWALFKTEEQLDGWWALFKTEKRTVRWVGTI